MPMLEGFFPAGLGLCLCLPERDFETGKDVFDNGVDSTVNSHVILCVLSGQALHNPRLSPGAQFGHLFPPGCPFPTNIAASVPGTHFLTPAPQFPQTGSVASMRRLPVARGR